MKASILKERFLNSIPPPLPNDWEAEENLEHLLELPEKRQSLILKYVPAIWPVSNSLCYSYLSYANTALSCLDDKQMGEWVSAFLEIYEKEGLKDAQSFMVDVRNNFLCRLKGETGITLDKAGNRLLHYATGLAQKEITLEESNDIYTDTASIFLPERITAFTSESDNFLLYKLAITAQVCLIRLRTYDRLIPCDILPTEYLQKTHPGIPDQDHMFIEDYWDLFPDPQLAEDIYTLSVGFRVNELLKNECKGLWKDTAKLRDKLVLKRDLTAGLTEKSRILENITRYLVTGKKTEMNVSDPIFNAFISEKTTEEKTEHIFNLLQEKKGPYKRVVPLFWLGRLEPHKARETRTREREDTKQKFIQALAAIIPAPPALQPEDSKLPIEKPETSPQIDSNDLSALLIPPESQDGTENPSKENQSKSPEQFLSINGLDIEIPESLKSLIAEIVNDFGHVPEEYISAADGFSGNGIPSGQGVQPTESEKANGAVTYDEWDYRRKGFRKDWCILNEKKVHPVKGSFVTNTLNKYRGPLIKLKKQFEMIRSAERFVKRQRDGDDIDLDAVIESISDQCAGLPESEKLFVKLRHETRDIGVMFLIDMSSSTEGWIGEALKESLILMGEALEVLGDRYAIAGFSGMRRTRSEFFHIKDFDEPYNEEIQGRIAGIAPQEYTRMGPAIRHATSIMQTLDAKIRLLVILSDGKPEDYDDYKADYAIEDTRHALIEAKAAGIHPFCITIDKKDHDYNAHMYGKVNYIFLEKVKDLPIRMPAIYRNLTT